MVHHALELLKVFGGIYAAIMVAAFVIRKIRGHAPTPSVASGNITTGKKRWYFNLALLIPAVIMVIGLAAFGYMNRSKLMGRTAASALAEARSAAVAADPCSQCRPDDKTIDVDTVHDDGKITWAWSGPCVGGAACGNCQVKPQSCTTENDTTYAAKCACTRQ